jgi:hypothetical protein
VPDKAERVRQFHDSTLKALGELIGAAGLAHPRELRRMHIQRRISPTEVRSFAEIYPTLSDGELLTGCGDPAYIRHWALADSSSFAMVAARSAA